MGRVGRPTLRLTILPTATMAGEKNKDIVGKLLDVSKQSIVVPYWCPIGTRIRITPIKLVRVGIYYCMKH